MNRVKATMESLPEEVMELFGQYLSASDLASCCAVSRKWREIFGRNRLWRVHCDKALVEVLDENNSVVEPLFKSPQPDDSTLTSISEWRLNYMKQIRLRNNWSSGNFKTEQLRIKLNMLEYMKCIVFKDCYLLLFKCSELEVWNFKNSPEFKSSFPFKAHPEIYFNEFKVFEVRGSDKFVTVDGSVVRVFNLCCIANNLELLHVFSFETKERCMENTEESVQDLFTQEFYEGTLCAVVGNVFVGIDTNPSPPKMHIWNLETCQKLKEVDCPFSTMHWWQRSVPTCDQTMNIVLEGEESVDGNGVGHWYVYSLTRLMLLPFHEVQVLKDHYEYHSIILGKYIAIQVHNSLRVYNYLTSEIVYSNASATTVVGNLKSLGHFVVFGNHDNELSVVNPSNDNSMIHLIYEYRIDAATTVGNRAIIVVNNNDSNLNIKYSSVEKMNDECRWVSVPLYQVSTLATCLTNQSRTKLILMKPGGIAKLKVVHFW